MTRLPIASLFAAVVAGAYAALMLTAGQLIHFGIAAAICAGSSVAAGLIAYAGRRRRKEVARGPAAAWEGRDPQAATAADQQCPFCGGAPNTECLNQIRCSAGRAAFASPLNPETTR
jgi:hypothetical protein